MPGLQKIQVRLVERGDGHEVGGGHLTYDDAPWLRRLPCSLFLSPGIHTLTASHPSRTVCQPNPRQVDVPVQTDPEAGPLLVAFEAEPEPADGARDPGSGAG